MTVLIHHDCVTLADLKPGMAGIIQRLDLPPQVQQMLLRFGLTEGAEVRFSRRAPLGDPWLFAVDGAEVALRVETARQIFILPGTELLNPLLAGTSTEPAATLAAEPATEPLKE